MIDIADVNTYPKELEEFVFNEFQRLSEEVVAKIKAFQVEYECDVRCAVEDYFSPSESQFYKGVINILNKYNLILYHGTKVLDRSCILTDGLKTNAWDIYKQNVEVVLKQLDYSDSDVTQVLKCIEHEYKRKYFELSEPQLCFFSSLSMIESEEGSAGYEQFCENIGGEIVRWALKEKYPKLYEPLHKNGEGIICKFVMPFDDVVWWGKDIIAYQFISSYAAKFFFDFPYEIRFDGVTAKNIDKNQIIELIPYDKYIDY